MNENKIAELEAKINVRRMIIARKEIKAESLKQSLAKIIAQIESLETKRRDLNLKRTENSNRLAVHRKALNTLEAYIRVIYKAGGTK